MSLPDGWAETTLGQISEPFQIDDPTKSPVEEFVYVDIGSIDNKRLEIVEPKTLIGRDAPSRARRRIRTGDVLFSTVRPYLKNIARVPAELNEAITSTGICVLRPSADVASAFIFRRVSSQDFIDAMTLASDGTMYPAIADRDVLNATISLPPAAEQLRIVAKLDALFVRLARARAEVDRVSSLARKQKQAVLSKYLGDASFSIEKAAFSNQIELLTSGSRDWSQYYDRGSSVFVLAGNVRPLRFDPTPKRYIDPPLDSADARRSRIEKDDLLLTIVGAGTGDICRVNAPVDNYFVCQSVARIKLRQPSLSSFYMYWFSSDGHGGRDFKAAMYGAARPHLSFEQLNGFLVPTISAEAAEAVVLDIERAFAHIGCLEAEAARSRALLDRLEAAILTKAFKGELAPQDANDEPASVLLERIRAQRAAVVPSSKTKRGKRLSSVAG